MNDIMEGFPPGDIRMTTYTNSAPGAQMRITHTPTGLYTEGSGKSPLSLRRRLMVELRAKVDAKTPPLPADATNELKGTFKR